jgi:ABC-2 type transport system ATP-binding protein
MGADGLLTLPLKALGMTSLRARFALTERDFSTKVAKTQNKHCSATPNMMEAAPIVRMPERIPAAPAVRVRGVQKSFPRTLNAWYWFKNRGGIPRRKVLHDVNLEIRQGTVFGLLGPNGAGKTTLLKLLATLCIPDQGEIVIDGIDARSYPLLVKQRIGLCTSEERSFYFRLTARSNLRFFGTLMGLHGVRLDQRIEEVARFVDLAEALDRRFDTFSSGMRQRLSLARALLADPPIILLDEPTRAVDPLHAHEIRSLIRNDLVDRHGKTAILATNLLDEAWTVCDEVAIINRGRIVALGPPKILDHQFSQFNRMRIKFESHPDGVALEIKKIAGVGSVTDTNADGHGVAVEYDPSITPIHELLRLLVTSGATIKAMQIEEPRPLDVFLGLTQDVGTS